MAACGRRQPGFTLIEILVVLVIITIIVTMAVVRFGPNDGDIAQREAERLALLFETVRDEAIASGSTLGWSADDNLAGYRFWQQAAGAQWQPASDIESLRPRQLPVNTRIEAVTVNLAALGKEAKVVFAPSGVNAPFSLDIRSGEAVRHLVADPLGRISVAAPAVAAP
ncbi:type II secretion system minor pseudopilin GspH [Chitinimonas sp.]|uniref:type II secretion system minor pseudopilin GspH n=1 Tax=Chitinimonas sp. TaxID=1934313 RepID=UPI0035AED4B6